MKISLGQGLRELPGPLLLTGHTGFKGTWMTLLLERLGVSVIGYSLHPEKNSLFNQANRIGLVKEKFADIRNYEELETFIDLHRPTTIIHMAAQPLVLKSYENPRETFDVNVMGTVNVLDVAFKKDFVKAIVVVTTDKVYRNDNSEHFFIESDPLEGKDPYSASKVGAESVVTAWQQISRISGGPKVVSVRAGNVIGGGDLATSRLLPDIVRHLFFEGELQVRNLQATRPWQHVLDPLSGYLRCLEYVLQNQDIPAINFSGLNEKPLKVSEVLSLSSKCASHFNLRRLSPQTLNMGNPMESENLSLDSNLAQELLGFRNIWTQEEAIFSTLEWWYKIRSKEVSVLDACRSDIVKVIGE